MPLLNQNTFGSQFLSYSRMMEVYRQQLEQARGVSGKLNQSVGLGVDKLLQDAIGESILEANCPFIRIAADTQGLLIPSIGGVLNSTVNLRIFFVMSFGKPGGTVIPNNFDSLRDQYIAWNLEYLKERELLPNASIGFLPVQWKDDRGKRFWWLTGDQVAPVNHQTPFDIFGNTKTIPVSSGFTVSRVDYKVTVRNHATFMNLNKFISYEIPSGTIDGTNPTFTLLNKVAGDLNGNPAYTYVSVNGSLRFPGIAYTGAIGSNSFTFTSGNIPQPGDEIGVGYYAY